MRSGVGRSGATTRSIRLTGTDRHALVLGSRTHLYEGKGVRRVVHGVRTASAAGARVIVLTNGCGGLNPDWAPGTPVLIRDHINLTTVSPLEGATAWFLRIEQNEYRRALPASAERR